MTFFIFATIVALFVHHLLSWTLISLFIPANSDLGLHAFRFDDAIQSRFPMERPWFISSGFICLARFLKSLPFELRSPAIHLFDDALLWGMTGILLLWSRRTFKTIWPALIASTFLISRLFESPWYELINRDWYAAMFSIAGVLAAGSSNSRFAAVAGSTLWIVGLQFRPQVVLLFPCLFFARLGLQDTGNFEFALVRKALIDTLIGLIIGFVIVHLPLWLIGGFPNYYLDTLEFMKKGGHAGKTTRNSVLKNFLILNVRQAELPYQIILPALALLSLQRQARVGQRIWLLIGLYLALATSVWIAVNPIITHYHRWPMFIAEAIILAMITGSLLTIYSDRMSISRTFAIVLTFSLAIWCDPVVIVQGLIRQSIDKIQSRDLSPHMLFMTANEYPPAPWQMDRQTFQDFYDYLGSKVESTSIPCEFIELETRPIQNSLMLRNPGVVGDSSAWPSLYNIPFLYDSPEVFRLHLGKYVESLKSIPDAFVIWIPTQGEKTDISFEFDISGELKTMFDTIRNEYEPVAKFGEVEIRRKKPKAQ
jgi:hypothetical protein